MKIVLRERSYFTFRGVKSHEIDLLGKTASELMRERLSPEETEEGDRIVIDAVYPFLTRDRLLSYADEREGSYRFAGGCVIREGSPLSGRPRLQTSALGQGLFTLKDLPAVLSLAARESAELHLAGGALVEEGAEVSYLAVLGEGAIVRHGARVLGRSVVGEGAEIGGGSLIADSRIGAGTSVLSSAVFSSEVGENCTVGPYACLRPGCTVESGCRIGDFVELKNASLGRRCKAAHLAYVGDADLGERVNVGCGVVFANYDGKRKWRTKVGNGVFLGSNCNLVAPLELGDGAFVAAGTTLTHDLARGDFCIGRCRETVKPGRAGRYYDPE